MVDDLKEQEGMHGVRCLRTGRHKANPRAPIRYGEFVANLLLDGRSTRRVCVVNEHRRFEIPGGKHRRDVPEVSPTLIDARSIFRVVGRNVDLSSVAE